MATTFFLIVCIVLPFPEYHVVESQSVELFQNGPFTWHCMFKAPPCLFLDAHFCCGIVVPCIDVPVCTDHLEGTILDSGLLMLTDRFSCHMWKEVLILNHIVYIYVIYSSVIQKVIF